MEKPRKLDLSGVVMEPSVTRDELPTEPEDGNDARLLADRPPHHDREG